MQWIIRPMKWIMLVSGVLTCTMLMAAIDPQGSLRSSFGSGVEGEVAVLVTRNWGALIALVGAMLIYGAFRPAVRGLVLTVAGASKLFFIALVLSHGSRFLGHQAGIAVVVDAAMVLLFAGYLVAARTSPGAAKSAVA